MPSTSRCPSSVPRRWPTSTPTRPTVVYCYDHECDLSARGARAPRDVGLHRRLRLRREQGGVDGARAPGRRDDRRRRAAPAPSPARRPDVPLDDKVADLDGTFDDGRASCVVVDDDGSCSASSGRRCCGSRPTTPVERRDAAGAADACARASPPPSSRESMDKDGRSYVLVVHLDGRLLGDHPAGRPAWSALTRSGRPDRLELGYWLSSEEHPPDRARRARGRRGSRPASGPRWSPTTSTRGSRSRATARSSGRCSARSRARPTTLRVGTGVTAPIHRVHPLVIAHAAATVEMLMPGRFFLGLGTGERLNEQVMGQRWPDRAGAPDDAARRRSRSSVACGRARRVTRTTASTSPSSGRSSSRCPTRRRRSSSPPAGEDAAELAGEMADGMVGVGARPDDRRRVRGGRRRRQAAPRPAARLLGRDRVRRARTIATRWWPNGGDPRRRCSASWRRPRSSPPRPSTSTDDMVAKHVVCGPDPERLPRRHSTASSPPASPRCTSTRSAPTRRLPRLLPRASCSRASRPMP